MNTKIATLLSSLLTLSAFGAGVNEKWIEYQDGAQAFEGFLAMPSSASKAKPVPGVLVIHNWMGVSEETKSKARELAKLGYAAFAADIFGKDERPKTREEAGPIAGRYKSDRALYRKRLTQGLKQLEAVSGVDPSKLAAIGYCFGGLGALELARTGAPIKGAVSFHGGIDSASPDLGKNIQAKVLLLHGADDPFVTAKDLTAVEEEMRANKIDWQLVKYGNAVHSFTERAAGNDNSKGAAYNAEADRRSWAEMQRFFKEIF